LARKKKASKKKLRARDAGRQLSSEALAAPPPEHVSAPVAPPGAPPPPDDEPVAIDLDAELDDVDSAPASAGTVERLVAEALGRAVAEPLDDEPPLIDLDAEEPPAAKSVTSAAAPARRGPERLATPGAPSEWAAVARPRPTPPPPRPRARDPGAFDLGSVSSPEVRDRLLAEALAHAEHKEARYRVPYRDSTSANLWKALLVVVLLAAAGVLAVAPPQWIRLAPAASLGRADALRGLRLALLLQAQQVEAFRLRTQRLPSSLDEVPSRFSEIRYVRSGSRAYQLVAYERDGSAVVYDSAAPTPPFRALTPVWRAGAPRP
jgi:hypothetical protein